MLAWELVSQEGPQVDCGQTAVSSIFQGIGCVHSQAESVLTPPGSGSGLGLKVPPAAPSPEHLLFPSLVIGAHLESNTNSLTAFLPAVMTL